MLKFRGPLSNSVLSYFTNRDPTRLMFPASSIARKYTTYPPSPSVLNGAEYTVHAPPVPFHWYSRWFKRMLSAPVTVMVGSVPYQSFAKSGVAGEILESTVGSVRSYTIVRTYESSTLVALSTACEVMVYVSSVGLVSAYVQSGAPGAVTRVVASVPATQVAPSQYSPSEERLIERSTRSTPEFTLARVSAEEPPNAPAQLLV